MADNDAPPDHLEADDGGLAALQAEAAIVDQGAAPAAAAPAAAAPPPAEVLQSAEKEATAIVELLAAVVKQFFPVLDYQEGVRVEAAKKLGPVLAKYNPQGSVLGRYKEEIEAGLFFGGLIIGSIRAVRNPPKEVADDGGQPAAS